MIAVSSMAADRWRALVFDLDGTLVDSAPDLAAAVNRLLVAEGRRQLELGEVEWMVGDGVHKLVERALAATGPVPAPHQPALVRRFLADYQANALVHTRPFPGVSETLAQLRARGLALAVCTNKPTAAAMAVLHGLGLAAFFDAVVGGDSLPVRKPEPGPLLHILDRLGVAPDAVLMVGDSANDVATARAAGVPVVVVAYGYGRDPADELGADAVIERIGELPALIDGLRRQHRTSTLKI